MEFAHPSSDIVIKHCEKYTYIGPIFPADGSMNTVSTEHGNDKSKHVLKLISFLRGIRTSHFMLKEKS